MSERTNKRDDGGDAFPVPCAAPFGDGRMAIGGMSRRDWLAGLAMQGLLASGDVWIADEDNDDLAGQCYRMADAMIAEGKKQP